MPHWTLQEASERSTSPDACGAVLQTARVGEAWALLEEMSADGIAPDEFAYTALINGYKRARPVSDKLQPCNGCICVIWHRPSCCGHHHPVQPVSPLQLGSYGLYEAQTYMQMPAAASHAAALCQQRCGSTVPLYSVLCRT
jgi:pentatricopeptide repeat protein